MTNTILYLLKTEPTSAATLSVKPCNEYEKEGIAAQSCERFLRAAATLPEGGCLVWQLDGCLSRIFYGAETPVTSEDLGWMFEAYADVKAAPHANAAAFCQSPRKVYALLETGQEPGEERRYTGGRAQYHRGVLDGMERLGGMFRIAAGPAGGAVLISLPVEMPLRMNAMLSMAFPGLQARELSAEGEAFPAPLSENRLGQVMTGLMEELVPEFPEGELCAEECDEPDERTPIETLDLSVRAYNCLRRAGIVTVEQLRSMRESELSRVRNLGKKCTMEVLNKLSASPALSAPEQEREEECDPFRQLEALVGLENVKEQMRKLAAFARMEQEMERRGKLPSPIVLNMEFVGNPGTAKTTVARIAAGIFYKLGLLSHREIVEVGRADLIAHYEGQTAGKVRDVFDRARGKLLFIDEAYSLVETWEGAYGDEAISTLVQEMENHRGKTIVVFAGYPDKMADFFARNPGLRSRVPFSLRFDDYSVEEMVRITALEAKKRGFSLSPEAETTVASVCRSAARRPELGNGRFCRNLAESAVLNYAARVFGADSEVIPEADFALEAVDFTAPEAARKTRRTAIGFGAPPLRESGSAAPRTARIG